MTAQSKLVIDIWIIKEASGGPSTRTHGQRRDIILLDLGRSGSPEFPRFFQANYRVWIWCAASLQEWVRSFIIVSNSGWTVYVLSLFLTRFTMFILSPHDSFFCLLVIPMLGFFHYANEDFVLVMLCFDFPVCKFVSCCFLIYFNNLGLHDIGTMNTTELQNLGGELYMYAEGMLWTIISLSDVICMD